MTDKEKIEAYDKAVKQAEKEILACGSLNCDAARQIFRLFPQLEMSEDEKTRAQIVRICDEWLKGNPSARPCLNDVAWLKNLLNRLKTAMEYGEGMYYLHKDGVITYIGSPATEEQPTDTGHTNVESDYDKGYREGHRFGLRQTQDYMIGRTFKGLIPCWINAPSTLSPLHKYHGKNAVVMHENNGGFRCICIDEKEPVSFHIPSGDVLVEGWKKKPDAWKPTEEQIKGLKFFLDFHRPQRNAGTTNWKEFDAVESLYEQLKKF